MTRAIDFAALQDDTGVVVALAQLVLRRGETEAAEPCSGFSAIAAGRLHAQVVRFRGERTPEVTVLVEGSADGNSWSTVHEWTFGRDELEGFFDLDAPQEYLRVTATPSDGVREAYVNVRFTPSYLDAPSSASTSTPGDGPPTWGTTLSTQIITGAEVHPMASTTSPITPLTQAERDAGYHQEVLVEAWCFLDNSFSTDPTYSGLGIIRGNKTPTDAYDQFDSGKTIQDQSAYMVVNLAGSADMGGHSAFAMFSAIDTDPVGDYADMRITDGDLQSGGATMLMTAITPGNAGNDITFEATEEAGDNSLLVTVVGKAITVRLATSNGSSISKFQEVADALTASPEASALITAVADGGNPDTAVMPAQGLNNFLNGQDDIYYMLWTDGGNVGQITGFAGIRTTVKGIAP